MFDVSKGLKHLVQTVVWHQPAEDKEPKVGVPEEWVLAFGFTILYLLPHSLVCLILLWCLHVWKREGKGYAALVPFYPVVQTDAK